MSVISQPWMQGALGLIALLLAAGLAFMAVQWGFARLPKPRRSHRRMMAAILFNRTVIMRAVQVLPAVAVHALAPVVPHLSATAISVLQSAANAAVVLLIARVLHRMLEAALHEDQRRIATGGRTRTWPIKAYVQLAQLMVALAATVVVIAVLADRSPLIVLSGFGAMSAVLILVFQDTIKSFVAGVQIESDDLLHVGDWIEMPQAGANGAAIDVTLNSVKIRNWDNTIVTVPTWRLMNEGFKNWRGMSESGARRIMRSLVIDAGSIRFLDEAEIERLQRVALIAELIRERVTAIRISHEMRAERLGDLRHVPANQRRLTNIGTFRAYALAYLRAHPGVRQDLSVVVRMMPPGAEGVPIELYCFTGTTAWGEYESIQSDIFDHLLAILPEFGLQIFQNLSSAGAAVAVERWHHSGVRAGRPAGAGGPVGGPGSA